MKNQGNGQAKVLTEAEMVRLFLELKKNPRDACLFGICLFTGCRISEARQLHTTDIGETTISFRKATTKGKLKTRTIAISQDLKILLDSYHPGKAGLLFPGMRGRSEYLTRQQADRIFRDACQRAAILGASTHSFRRTALTMMHRAGVPLRHIMEISGHSDLGTLQRYLEVLPEEVAAAVSVIKFY